jgi:transposase InsO family protein
MESFFATLKGELAEEADYQTRDHDRADVFHNIEGFYKPRRLHCALGYLTRAESSSVRCRGVSRSTAFHSQ